MPKLTGLPGGKTEKPARPRPSRAKAKPEPEEQPEPAQLALDPLAHLEEAVRSTRQQIKEDDAEARARILADTDGEPVKVEKPRPRRGNRSFKPEDLNEEAAPEPTDEPPAAESGEDTPEPEKAKEGAKERPKRPPVRRPPLVPDRPVAKAFTPDLSKLQPLDEVTEYLRIVLYGDQGVGKTTSMATLAHRGRIAVVDPEKSLRPKALRKMGIPTQNIMHWTDWSHGGLEQFFVTIKAELEREPGSIFAVCIDTISTLAQWLLEEAVRTSLATPAMQKAHPDRSPLDVYQEDYGTLTEMIRSSVTRHLFQLPCHVILTAHTRRGENENKMVRVGPSLPPAAQGAVLVYSDWVLMMTREDRGEDEVRFIRSAPRGQIEAKDRFHVLEPVEENMTLLDLLEKWEQDQ